MARLKSWLRNQIEVRSLLRELKYMIAPWAHFIEFYRTASDEQRRQVQALDLPIFNCPDYHKIHKVPDAGKIVRGRLVMHNGVKVVRSCYYGYANLKYLQKTGGVHEPQEEHVFGEVLKVMPPGATMLELGAYWAFYSLWFHQAVIEPRCYLVEPLLSNVNYGRKNFSLNGFSGEFEQAYVGRTSCVVNGIPQICVDDFLRKHRIDRLNVLHSDIQGAELDMLRGAQDSLDGRKIDYIFVSTHSNELHAQCLSFLRKNGYEVIAECDLDNSYSPDGVLVARRHELEGVGHIGIAQRSEIERKGRFHSGNAR